jgi:Tol biopolymer transport system component
MFQKRFWRSIGAGILLLASASADPAQAQTTTRVSVGAGNVQGNNDSYRPRLSADGRYVVYTSDASNLVAGDTNGLADVFRTELATGTTIRVSVSSAGAQANGTGSYVPAISGNGRYITFESDASNLVTGDANNRSDIFVRDTLTNTTERVSVGIGAESNGDSQFPVISRDGRYIAFESTATNLVEGDTNNREDIFVYDRLTRQTRRVSVNGAGFQGNGDSANAAISANGNFIAFYSEANNLVNDDGNGFADVFVRNIAAGTTIRVSLGTDEEQGDDISGLNSIFISGDGNFVAFDSYASTFAPNDTDGILDVFVRDIAAGTTQRISVSTAGGQVNDDAFADDISDDGRYVLFDTGANNLVGADTNGTFDVFIRDRQSGTTTRVSTNSTGAQGNDDSFFGAFTPDANTIAFSGFATNLVTGDTNLSSDVFVRSPFRTTATVNGVLSLQGITSTAPDQLITFTFSRAAGDIVRTASVGPDGAFSVSGLPRDQFTLLISGGSYLAAKTPVNLLGGSVTLPNVISLKTGDTNADNAVDITDLLALIAAYNQLLGSPQYLAAADFNLDGANDITDLLLLIANYNQEGETLP